MSAVPTLASRILAELQFAYTTEELAQRLGVSTPTLECTLTRMRREQQVKQDGVLWKRHGELLEPVAPVKNPSRGIGLTQRRILVWLLDANYTGSELAQRMRLQLCVLLKPAERLVSRGLVVKDEAGRYCVTDEGEKVALEGRT